MVTGDTWHEMLKADYSIQRHFTIAAYYDLNNCPGVIILGEIDPCNYYVAAISVITVEAEVLYQFVYLALLLLFVISCIITQ